MLPLAALIFLLSHFPDYAYAAPVHMVGDIKSSETGTCLGLTPASARGAAQSVSRVRIAAVLKRLKEMKVDVPRFLTPLKFDLVSSGRSNQFGGSRIVLSMVALDPYGNVSILPVSSGTVAHEIGHWFGHNMDIRGKTAYEAFRSGAFRKCHGFDGYSTHFRDGRAHGNDLNETFAEVFSGYLTAPDFLKQACPAGYEFMRDQVFRGESSPCLDPDKKVPLPRARPAEAPSPLATSTVQEEDTTTSLPSADGEHPIPLPRARPLDLGDSDPGQTAAPAP